MNKLLDDSETTDCEYKARISLLPHRGMAYKVSNDFTRAYEYHGIWFREPALRGLMWAQDHFIPHPAAILVASYPKTGTTWLKALSFSIATRNKYHLASNPLQTASPHEKMATEDLEFVSIEEGFQLFCEGYSFYGPYWEHMLGYWKASLQRPVSNVKKLAAFIGHPFSAEEEQDGVVERLVESCSFKNMSNLEVNKSGVHDNGLNPKVWNSVFFGKAKAGEWKKHLPAKMKEQMDEIMELKLRDSGLTWGKT
ncbi:hypothetical protein AgCh_009333 [Apium graveolens]